MFASAEDYLSDRGITQPRGVLRLDPNDPINVGMVGCWVLGTNGKYIDLCGNNDGTPSGTVVDVVNPFGRASLISADNTSNRIDLGSISSTNPLSGSDTQELSIFTHLHINASSTDHGNSFPRIIDKSNGGSAANGWAFYIDTSVSQFALQINGAVNWWPTNFVDAIDTVGTLGASYSRDGGRSKAFHNGKVAGSYTTPLPTIPTTTTNAAILNWNGGATDRQYRKPVYLIRVWKRELPEGEHLTLNAYPYRGIILANLDYEIYAAVSGSTGVTLSLGDLSQVQSLDNVDLTQGYNLTVDDATQGQSLDNVALTQAHILTVASATQTQTLDNVVLSQAAVLAVQELTQGQVLDNVALTQAHTLVVDQLSQAQLIDNITLSTGLTLAVASLDQGQNLDNVGLTQANTLTVAELGQSQTVDSVLLTQAHNLTVDSSAQSQVLDNVVLSLSVILNPADLSQSQVLDGVTLTQANVLEIQSLLQSQGLGNVALVQGSVLSVAGVSQSQTIDQISWIVVTTPDSRTYVVEGVSRVVTVN